MSDPADNGGRHADKVFHDGDMDPDLAQSIATMLELSPDLCVQVKGRIGALPHIRYDHGGWEVATWAGPGLFMGFWNHYDREEIVDLIASGPMVIPKRVENLHIWEIYDGSIPEDMTLYLVDCDCGAATMREVEEPAEKWAEDHADTCDEAGILEVKTVD